MASAGRPVTVPDLLAGDDSVSQSSLYRNLVVLVDVGVLQRVAGWGNHDRFELSESLSGHHHHHLTCTVCGKVDDITPTATFEQAMAAESAAVAARSAPWSPATASTSTAAAPTAPPPPATDFHKHFERFCTISRPRIASTRLQKFWVAKIERFCTILLVEIFSPRGGG